MIHSVADKRLLSHSCAAEPVAFRDRLCHQSEIRGKLYGALMNAEETRWAMELTGCFVVVTAFKGVYHATAYQRPGHESRPDGRPNNSSIETRMSVGDLRGCLSMSHLPEDPLAETTGFERTKTP
ncbi:MAG: hypothetical protein HQL59_01680 [Magnetococcales bacterium]|nr:hypothetical protein [Magnetococcales bacterium]